MEFLRDACCTAADKSEGAAGDPAEPYRAGFIVMVFGGKQNTADHQSHADHLNPGHALPEEQHTAESGNDGGKGYDHRGVGKRPDRLRFQHKQNTKDVGGGQKNAEKHRKQAEMKTESGTKADHRDRTATGEILKKIEPPKVFPGHRVGFRVDAAQNAGGRTGGDGKEQ